MCRLGEGSSGVATTVVDINCDLGEGFGHWRLGDVVDAQLMEFISSANIATGFHAGDPNLMDATVRLAMQHGVSIGAHPGFRDLQGFGRRRIQSNNEEIINDMIYQIGALREFARRYDAHLQHVKPHGALYMEMASSEQMSRSFVQFMRSVATNAYILCMDISQTYRVAREAGHPVARELYADRDYDSTGSIVFTRHSGKLNPDTVARKVLRACLEGKVRTVDGADIDVEFESICFHSDTPGSLEIGRRIRDALADSGIRICPLSSLTQSVEA
jgi:5-oxoprolinase (ATP-hydrolysing) subunit A